VVTDGKTGRGIDPARTRFSFTRMHSIAVAVFAPLLTLQALLVAGHDLVNVPGWAHGRQVRAVLGARKFWSATVVNAVFPAIALRYALRFWRIPPPPHVASYWAIYCAITVGFAVTMWWLPYFFGTDAKNRKLYLAMYAGTKHVLPARGDNPRPNLLHVCFHALFAINLGLALWLRFG
jgi:hypothetical protein